MGCGCSRGEKDSLTHDPSGLSSVLDDDDESSVEDDELSNELTDGYAVSAPEWIDKMFQEKAELVDLEQNLANLNQQTFNKHFLLNTRDCMKALSAFRQMTDKQGRLRNEKLCRMLRWPTDRNRVVARMIVCFDGDRDKKMNFREFLMVAAMLMPECSEVDKLRFWWWVMLFSDESSSDSSNSTSAARQAPIVPHRQVVQVATGASGEASAPLETLGRFFRDVLVSCTGLKIAKAIAVFSMNTNPAPSKVYSKVMNLLLSKGKLKMKSQVSFGQFVHLCCKSHPPFRSALVYFFDTLAMLLRAAPHPHPMSVSDSLKLKAFFYDKVDELKEIEKGESNLERARKKSGLPDAETNESPLPIDGSHHHQHDGDTEGQRQDATPADDGDQTSGYSSVSDPESDMSQDYQTPRSRLAAASDGLFSEEASPAPKFATFWEKQADRKPATRPLTREESRKRAETYLAKEYEEQLVLRRSALSAHLDELDSAPDESNF